MRKKIMLVALGVLVLANVGLGQDTIAEKHIPALNRIAEEYDRYKCIFGIVAGALAILMPLGLWVLLKTKAEEWVMSKIAKEADLKVEYVKAAVMEFARIAELKKKKIWVISAAQGQQANVKKVFDGCGFTYDGDCWKHVDEIDSLTLGKVDVILLNDQHDLPLTEAQIESAMKKFKTNVGYFYFGDKMLPSKDYREKYKIDLDFCNSATRLEMGLLSLLKIL